LRKYSTAALFSGGDGNLQEHRQLPDRQHTLLFARDANALMAQGIARQVDRLQTSLQVCARNSSLAPQNYASHQMQLVIK
jgi:hypothetical protein